MNTSELKRMLNEYVDWTEVHILYALGDWGQTILIRDNGTHYVIDSGTSLRGQDYVGTIFVKGQGNIDETPYLEDYTEIMCGRYLDECDGRVYTEEKAIMNAIIEGEWDDLYQAWKEEILEQNEGE